MFVTNYISFKKSKWIIKLLFKKKNIFIVSFCHILFEIVDTHPWDYLPIHVIK